MFETGSQNAGYGRNKPLSPGEFVWCLVANVAGADDEGAHSDDVNSKKHFSPGTKLFCFPNAVGDRIRVLGRHRGGARLVEMMIPCDGIVGWRAQRVYRPDVIARMAGAWTGTEDDRSLAERLAAIYSASSS